MNHYQKYIHLPTKKLYTVNGAGGLIPVDGSSNASLPLWIVKNSKDWIKEDDQPKTDNVLPEFKMSDSPETKKFLKFMDEEFKRIMYRNS